MRTLGVVTTLSLLALGCGDPNTNADGDAGNDAGLTQGPSDDGRTNDGGSGNVSGTADGSGPGGDATSATTTTSPPADDSGDGPGDGPIFDVGGVVDVPVGGCNGGVCGKAEFSYIWIANSSESTLSKINTRTLVEEGRYYTRPDLSGNPSRTSVSVDGRAVAVANRMGGITKVFALEEDCIDRNGNGAIETSSGGAGSMLDFEDEECIAWHTPFPDATTQRPIAWTTGTYNPATCQYENQQIWSVSGNGSSGTSCGDSDGVYVYRLDGETGDIADELHLPDVDCGISLGPYGAAVDYNNDLWVYIWTEFTILHVEHDTLAHETISGGSYGITVDSNGRVWEDSGDRYDPLTGTWDSKIGSLPGSGGSGVAEDHMGRIWTATTGGVGWIDMETMMVGDTVALPESGNYRGIGVDFDGYIWAVLLGGTTAHKIDPVTYTYETFDGLNNPYTYSDMAGGQLSNVNCNPPAG